MINQNFIKRNSWEKTKESAFTLVETLVAISILLIAIMGPLTVVSQALQASYFSRDQVTAFYLAQDAVEYVRNVRDTNSLTASTDPTQWLTGLTLCMNAQGCQVDTTQPPPPSGGVYTCGGACNFWINANGVYQTTQQTGTQTSFKRTVYLTAPVNAAGPLNGSGAAGPEAIVKVIVTWTTGAQARSFTLEDHLTNWETTAH